MDMLVDEYLAYLRDTRQVSDNTFSSYRRDLEKLVQYLDERHISGIAEVKNGTIEQYLEALKKRDYAISTITRNFVAVRSFFRYLYSRGYIAENPSEWIPLPKGKSNPNIILTKQEMEALLKQPVGLSFKGLRDRAMLLLLYNTRIPISELVNLKVGDLDFEAGRVACAGQEHAKCYMFHQQTREALLDHIQYAELGKEDWLFPNRYGKPMSRQGFWKIVKNYAKEAGIEKEITLYSIKQGEI